MRFKSLPIVFFSIFGIFNPIVDVQAHTIEILDTVKNKQESFDQLIHSLTSLSYHIGTLKKETDPSAIAFEAQAIKNLWDNASQIIYGIHQNDLLQICQSDFEAAYLLYNQGTLLKESGQQEEAFKTFEQSFNLLSSVWDHAIELETQSLFSDQPTNDLSQYALRATNHAFEKNSAIPSDIKKEMRPYIIPETHPMNSVLNAIFKYKRATLNEQTFTEAGFVTLGVPRPRTFLRVASHPLLKDYLVKAYLDNELRKKRRKPSWKWLVQRCIGAEKIERIIQARKMKYFSVAKKWIYPLPKKPAPPATPQYTRHYALLLVTDMKLVPAKNNIDAWYHVITKKHLDELYIIMSRAKGSAYRPDNIWYTEDGRFAFIDTEYPNNGPDFSRIRRFLRPDMARYWDRLINHGGPR